MLALPTLLPYEVLLSETPARGGGASSGEALREFGDRGFGGSSKGGGEAGWKTARGTGGVAKGAILFVGSSTGGLFWLKNPGAGSSATWSSCASFGVIVV